ncbi:MAG: VWA domain-containing protein [Bacteroidota bacterium]
MIRFAYPGYLFAVILIPLGLGCIWLIHKKSLGLIANTFLSLPTPFGKISWLKLTLRSTALILLFLALLGPYRIHSSNSQNLLGREIYFLLDISASMNAQDLSPSRLYKAKRMIRQLVRKLQGDKIGLIVFSDDAFLQCPLTRDYELFETLLGFAEPQQFSRSGTQYRPALSMALDHLNYQNSSEKERNQAVILLSDGEDYGNAYPSILDRYKKNRIKLFAIGLGTRRGSRIPQKGSQGFIEDPQGLPVISSLKDSTLKAIARNARTKFLDVSHIQVSIDPIFEQIESTLVAPLDKKRIHAESSLVTPLLLITWMILMLNAFLLPRSASSNSPIT